jgi:hypothetical protein
LALLALLPRFESHNSSMQITTISFNKLKSIQGNLHTYRDREMGKEGLRRWKSGVVMREDWGSPEISTHPRLSQGVFIWECLAPWAITLMWSTGRK